MRKGYECIGDDGFRGEDCLYYDAELNIGECTAIAGCIPLRRKIQEAESLKPSHNTEIPKLLSDIEQICDTQSTWCAEKIRCIKLAIDEYRA